MKKKKYLTSFHPRENDIILLDWEDNRGNVEVWRARDADCRERRRKARKRSQSRRHQEGIAIKASTWQDVTCGEQEKETSQI